MRKYNLGLFAAMIVAYTMIVVIALHTPIHSDDFTYSMKGLSIKGHLNHYMTWSGRVVADYISTFILGFRNHTFSAFFNSLGSILLIYNITKLPNAIDKKSNQPSAIIIFSLIFLLYWISNPNLGQVMFWVVGSSNYMWTTMIIVFFIRKTIEYRESEIERSILIPITFLYGLAAGASNENTSVTLVSLMIFMAIYYKIISGKSGKIIISGLIGSIIGTAIMVFAPGNFARASGSGLNEWRNSSFWDKLSTFIYKTIPDVMAHTWIGLLALSIVLLLYSMESIKSKKLAVYTVAMLGCFITANLVMVASPGYPPRAMNGQFIFLLCAIAICAAQIKNKISICTVIGVAALMFCYLFPAYSAMFISYKAAYKQSKIRDKIIYQAKESGHKDVKIPGYYFYGFKNKGDVFDTYHTPYSGPYYGMNKIEMYPVGFDYSVVFEKCSHPLKLDIYNNANIICIYSYRNKVTDTTMFIAEFSDKQAMNDKIRAFIKPVKNGNTYSQGSSLPIRTVTVDNRFFSYAAIKKDHSDYDHLIVGAYEKETGKIINQFIVK